MDQFDFWWEEGDTDLPPRDSGRYTLDTLDRTLFDSDTESEEEPEMAGVQAGSVNTIEVYNGEEGRSALRFIKNMDSGKTIYGWTDEQAATVAKIKMGGGGRDWILAEEGSHRSQVLVFQIVVCHV